MWDIPQDWPGIFKMPKSQSKTVWRLFYIIDFRDRKTKAFLNVSPRLGRKFYEDKRATKDILWALGEI